MPINGNRLSAFVHFKGQAHAALAVACLIAADCHAAYTTEASLRAVVTSSLAIYGAEFLTNVSQPHQEGTSGGESGLAYIAKTSEIPWNDEQISAVISGHTSGAALSTWGSTLGQIDALTIGAYLYAQELLDYSVYGPVSAEANLSTIVTADIDLTFDEPVRLSVWYYTDSDSTVQVSVAGIAQTFFGSGTAEFIATSAHLNAFAGASAHVQVDSIPDNGTLPSDSDIHPGAGASAAWVITSLDEPPPPPPPGPATTGRLPTGMPLDPNGGFDPVPIGARSLTVAPSGLTTVSAPTQVPFGEFQGALIESYAFSTGDIPITSLVIPTLPAGADLSLTFGQETRSVAAGEVVDFGPAGIEEFTLSGFDPANASQSPDALLLGLQFAGAGVTNIEARAVEFIVAADFNLDGAVDQDDLASWASHFGEGAATHSQGDANGDGIVDGDDFLYWQRQATPAAVTDAVPEPSAFAMIGVAVFGLISRRAKRPSGL